MKIVSTGSTLSSPAFQEKKKRKRRRRNIILTLVTLFLIWLLIFVSRQDRLTIDTIEVEGTNTVSSDEVKAFVKDYISGYYLWLVPHANALLYPRSSIEGDLLAKFSRLRSVGLTLEGTKVLNISVVEREPHALYCDKAESPHYASKCYFLDDTGYIFDEAPEFFGPVYFVYALAQPLTSPIGHKVMVTEEFVSLSQFISNLPDIGVTPLAVEIGESEFNLTLPHSTRIVWGRNADMNLIYSNLESFLNNDSIRSEKNFLEKVSLLDLRVDNKVFYTFSAEDGSASGGN